jgi:ABC-type branched-subunit amino acid transport system substrate-binding protein
MLDIGKPDLVVAFPGQDGTADMVKQARSAGVKVMLIKDPTYVPPEKPVKAKKRKR